MKFAIAGFPQTVRMALAGVVSLLVVLILAAPVSAITIQEVKSSGGVTAWLVEDYTVPIISMQFAFDGGTVQDPEGKEGLANLMTGLFDEGAGDLDSDAFQDRLDIAAADMSFSADRDSVGGAMRMLADHRDEAFNLLAMAVNAPRFDEDPIARIRAQIIAGIRANEKQPDHIASQRWTAALYGHHPYGRREEGSPETLGEITAQDLRDFHRRVFARSNLSIGVVGAIDAQTLSTVLDKVFGSLPEHPQLRPVGEAEPALGQVIAITADQPQTSLRLAYPGVFRDDPRFFATYLMNHILGGGTFSSRLYNEVREKRGLVYGIDSFLATREYSAGLGIGTSTRSDRAAETLAVIRQEVGRMAAEGPTAEELAAAKKYVIGAYAISNLDSSRAIAQTLVGLQQEDLGIDYIDRREKLIGDVTLKQVREMAKLLLSAEPAIMIVGPDPEQVVQAGQ